ncbi:MAG: HAMP domain-containing sensor histidine kinase [Nitriliruptor sp.]|uniref:sensor histidine kinase n=1 Tax=Nitriliruptor sp. TaxID=2448056 RepID=UPI0034A08AB6
MNGRITALISVELLLVVGGLLATSAQPAVVPFPETLTIGLFIVALTGLGLLPPIYLEHRRHGIWVTPTDGAILVGLFLLGPLMTVAAAMAAELVISLRFPQAPLKRLFNLVSMAGGYTAAALVFAVLGRGDPLDPLAWGAGALAIGALTVWDMCSTAALFALLENRPFRAVLNNVGPALLSSLVLSAALGLLGVVLVHEHPAAVLLIAPMLAILLVSTRALTQAQAERSRLERLYAASANLARLSGRAETLAGIAEESRALLTGAAAICLTARGDGPWHGFLFDDDGGRALAPATVARILAATQLQDGGVLELPDEPLGPGLPVLPSLVWARGHADRDVRVLVAVLLELPADEQGDHRADVLATFAAHAGSVIANIELHEDVQDALAHQVALNRQKSEFVAAVSHELRTPLATLIGTIQTMQRSDGQLTEQQRIDVLRLGANGGARLRSLIEDLLLVAAAEHQAIRVEHEEIDPVALLEEAIAELAPEVQERVELTVGPVGAFRSDEDKVRRIIINLVDNARKYAPEGPIEVHVSRGQNTYRFTVDDHGPGVAPEDRDRVFERFVQLDGSNTRSQGGTGLGLHLSRELAEMLGGTLTVGGSPGGGARFTLELPQRRGQDVVAAVTTPVPEGVEFRLPVSSPRNGIKASPLRRRVRVGAGHDGGEFT